MMKNSDNIYLYLIFSIVLHLLVIYLFFFGIPAVRKNSTFTHEQIVSFEMLAVSDTSNIKNQQKQLEKPIQNEQAKKVQGVPPIASQEKPIDKLETQKMDKDNSIDKPFDLEDKKIETKDIEDRKPDIELESDTILNTKKEIGINTKQEDVESNKLKSKEVIKPEKKIIKSKVPNSSDLDSLLKTLEKPSDGKEIKSDKYSRSNSIDQEEFKGQFDATLPLSISEHNLIKNQIYKHWIITAATQNLDEAVVVIRIKLGKTGEILEAEIIEKICKNISPSICQILANSAERAVWQASPITNLIPENYNRWKEFNLSFSLKEMQ